MLRFYLLQEKVACLNDNDARLAVDLRNKYRIQVAIKLSVLHNLVFDIRLELFNKF